MKRFRRNILAISTVATLGFSGCTSGNQPAGSSVDAPKTEITEITGNAPKGTAPTVKAPTVTSMADTRTPTSVAVSTGFGCTPETTPVGPRGEVTFVRDQQVWSSSAEGLADRCLYKLGTQTVNSLSWSPDGTALLLGPDQVARGATITKSGYLPTNTDVNWSSPNGSSLLATTSTGDLVKRNSSSASRTDISFLEEHRLSAYHPAGKAIASIGTAIGPSGEPTLGIWLADNQGLGSRLVIADESAAELGDLAYSANGDVLFFTAKHESETHVHSYEANDGLGIAFESEKPISMLTSSASEERVAVGIGDCSGEVETWFGSKADEFRSVSEFGITGSVTPVGWLPGRRLAVLVRPTGCSGPGQLRVVLTDEKSSWVVAEGVSVAAVRSPHAIPNELAASIGSQVVA